MIKNRSVPTDILLPHIFYRNVDEAIVWLIRVFGFAEHYRYGGEEGSASGAQIHLGGAWVMIAKIQANTACPTELGHETQRLTIFVDDVDAHFQRTKSAGAKIVEELHETVYGERQYGVEDIGGHRWIFSQHARDLSPSEWGATIAKPQ